MTSQKSLHYRVGVGIAFGLVVGSLGFYLMPLFIDQPSSLLRLAVLLWHVTFGAIVGLSAIVGSHSMLNFPIAWSIRRTTDLSPDLYER